MVRAPSSCQTPVTPPPPLTLGPPDTPNFSKSSIFTGKLVMYYWLLRYILHFNEVRSKIRIWLGTRRWGPLANQNPSRCAEVCRSASCRSTQTRSMCTISTHIRSPLTKSAQTKCIYKLDLQRIDPHKIDLHRLDLYRVDLQTSSTQARFRPGLHNLNLCLHSHKD